ncbi:hypothetical protein [Sphingomonas phyllosphaerae]|uniref:hypothetical protein n=1 Tax=Sphingomonas phyllosphaerae TaxID=257003 RepID=UPI0024132927|nr:hypothetical protein [Sphingomonas phyllosphaerae]
MIARWLAERTAKRQRKQVERSFIEDTFGPYPPAAIDRWDRVTLTERIARKGDLSQIEAAYARSRLNILEQKEGPSGRSARIAAWALGVSIVSALLALMAMTPNIGRGDLDLRQSGSSTLNQSSAVMPGICHGNRR